MSVPMKTLTISETQFQIVDAYMRDLIVTPEMFGAKGDGSTNDTTAFQNAVKHGGKVVCECGKTYKLDGGYLYTPANTTIDLNGATLVSGVANLFINLNNSSQVPTGYSGNGNIVIKNGTIVGGEILLAHGENIELNSIDFQNSRGGHFVQIMSCKRVRILNCKFKGLSSTSTSEHINLDMCYQGHFGLWPEGSAAYDDTNNDDIEIAGCVFEMGTGEFASMHDALCAHSHAMDVNADNHLFHNNVRIHDNVIINAEEYGIRAQDLHYSQIYNNYVYLTSTSAYPVAIGFGIGNVIRDNYFQRSTAGSNARTVYVLRAETELSYYNNIHDNYNGIAWLHDVNDYGVTFKLLGEKLSLFNGTESSGTAVSLNYPITNFNHVKLTFGTVSGGTVYNVDVYGYGGSFSAGQVYALDFESTTKYMTIGSDGETVTITGVGLSLRAIYATKEHHT